VVMRRFAPHGRSMAKHLAPVTRREAPRNGLRLSGGAGITRTLTGKTRRINQSLRWAAR